MSYQDEKYEEKEMEKREEKSTEEKSSEEKSYEEKYRRDPLGTLVWAVILIWAGVVWLANNFELLDRFKIPSSGMPRHFPFAQEAWSIFLLGVGVILLIEIVIRLTVPNYRRPILGTFILAMVFFGLGLGSWALIWPIVLIIIGATILLRGMLRKG